MADDELKKMNRKELLEMLLGLEKENVRLREELRAANEKLNERRLMLDDAGNLAEAVLHLNHVYEDMDKAAEQYLENIRIRDKESETLLCEAKEKAADIVAEAERTRLHKIMEADMQVTNMKKKMQSFFEKHPDIFAQISEEGNVDP